MIEKITEWILTNKIELLGAVLGITYIFLSIRQNILTWLIGILSSLFYLFVFFQSKLYAEMGLQGYYILISIYGWYFWLNGNRTEEKQPVPVRQMSQNQYFYFSIAALLIFLVLYFVLKNFTNTDVPFADGLVTSLSILATWMLARKFIENWLIWIFVDLVSTGLYVYKNLWPTVILFAVFTFMAFIGYTKWKKDLKAVVV